MKNIGTAQLIIIHRKSKQKDRLPFNYATMTKVLVDYSQIQLQENIPLKEEEVNRIAKHKRDFLRISQGLPLLLL